MASIATVSSVSAFALAGVLMTPLDSSTILALLASVATFTLMMDFVKTWALEHS